MKKIIDKTKKEKDTPEEAKKYREIINDIIIHG